MSRLDEDAEADDPDIDDRLRKGDVASRLTLMSFSSGHIRTPAKMALGITQCS